MERGFNYGNKVYESKNKEGNEGSWIDRQRHSKREEGY